MPVFGQFLQAGGAVFVDRGNSAVPMQSLQASGEEIKKHHTSIWVFPEGTRTSRPYHDMRPSRKAGLPLVPVGVFNAGTLKVRVLPPISTDGSTTVDVGDLSVCVCEQMIKVSREISDPSAQPPLHDEADKASANTEADKASANTGPP
ncbi:hypothetical protein BGW80DRAFT_1271901, partial [Lactifluus volemus]